MVKYQGLRKIESWKVIEGFEVFVNWLSGNGKYLSLVDQRCDG